MSKTVRCTAPFVAALALAVAGCGGGSSSGSGATAGTGSTGSTAEAVALTTPAAGCGSLPLPAVQDPDGVVAQLPADHQAAYKGYPYVVHKSPWADWKPKGEPPYKVGVAWGPSTAGFQVDMGKALVDRLKASPLVSDVEYRTMGADVNVPAQLANYNALVNEGVDIMIVEPLLAPPFLAPIKKAAEKGIPTVTVQTVADTPYAVNVSPNLTLANAEASARLLQMIGGKGNVLRVGGIPGVPSEIEADTAQKLVLKECPDVKDAGQVYGNFVSPNAKSETLKFLATHPTKIDGVLQSGTMTDGIMSAFQQTGRPMPIVADIGPTKGGVGYWINNRDSYQGVGTAFGPSALGTAGADVTLRMLEGQGPKTSNMVARIPLLTDENLDQWADKSWTLTTPGQPEGPPNSWFTDEYLDPFFANGAPPQGD
ncbi:substrate-binding domain-containing protein [Capillimicrobium parvum]|uniref:Periplasmic binding protein domain-containing protein n=1 Tax=Capillimicrobium parvum TaxID=2884022 RepID=A0A9E6XY88_9ACTN|nr:substrate-binding domain-containing protein [Capillimicrobium parvum]UGS36158.1 hypothetical protein DSM104329_02558 [Capillimicrobium parvum]